MLKKNKVLIVFFFVLVATFSVDLYMNWHLTENRQNGKTVSAPIEKSSISSPIKTISKKIDSKLSTSSDISTTETSHNLKKKTGKEADGNKAAEKKIAENKTVEKGTLVVFNRTQLIVEVRISNTKDIKQSNFLEPSKQISVMLPLGIYNIQVFDNQKSIISTGKVELKDKLGEVYYVKI